VSLCDEAGEVDDGPESRIQGRIEDLCRRRGYFLFHDRSKKVNAPGLPDLIIALPGGRTVWLELKSKGGRMSPEQTLVINQLLLLGHEVHIVRSFKAALASIAMDPRGKEVQNA
jgi:hypothetical protein